MPGDPAYRFTRPQPRPHLILLLLTQPVRPHQNTIPDAVNNPTGALTG